MKIYKAAYSRCIKEKNVKVNIMRFRTLRSIEFQGLCSRNWNIRFETAQTLTLTYIILTFTFFPITQLGKTAFYLHVRPSDAQMRHRQKAYGS